jgi:hypothetical protein
MHSFEVKGGLESQVHWFPQFLGSGRKIGWAKESVGQARQKQEGLKYGKLVGG